MIRWIDAARGIAGGRVHVAFEDRATSGFQQEEINRELAMVGRPESITWLPDDGRRVRAAWNGEPVPEGPFARAGTQLARRLRDAPVRQSL